MKTYSEQEIAEHVAQRLSLMPWPEEKKDPVPKSSAVEILRFALQQYGIHLGYDNSMKNSSGHLLAKFVSAEWRNGSIIWIYFQQGQYFTRILTIGDDE